MRSLASIGHWDLVIGHSFGTMPLFDSFKKLFADHRLDVAARFETLREAISGTMSNFYLARERGSGKLVGLKILDPAKTALFEARFKGLNKPAEGKVAMSMKHPRIVVTHEYGMTTKGEQYIVMDYVEGVGLSQMLYLRDPILEGKRLVLIREMAEALDYVHKQGYIHRDVCPRNFIVAPDAQHLKLIDFGLTLPATEPFMQPGNRTGTPLYMAPEVLRRRITDQRLDIFSFGVTAYQMLTHEHPWPVGDATGLAALSHDTEPPKPITEHRPQINPVLAEAVMQCISAKPDGRPDSMEIFLLKIRGLRGEDDLVIAKNK
jgi:serine/threonine-protein kinase